MAKSITTEYRLSMRPERRVVNPNGITARPIDGMGKLILLGSKCPLNVIEEMGRDCRVAVRDVPTGEIVELYVETRVIWTWTIERAS